MAEVPTLVELMDQYKTPEVMRNVTRIVLASGELAGRWSPDRARRRSE